MSKNGKTAAGPFKLKLARRDVGKEQIIRRRVLSDRRYWNLKNLILKHVPAGPEREGFLERLEYGHVIPFRDQYNEGSLDFKNWMPYAQAAKQAAQLTREWRNPTFEIKKQVAQKPISYDIVPKLVAMYHRGMNKVNGVYGVIRVLCNLKKNNPEKYYWTVMRLNLKLGKANVADLLKHCK